jgi:dihydroxyacetone kinase-like predicted kinase
MYGFCTQFIVVGEGLDVDEVRARVSAIAGSTVVIGDPRTVRIHAHAEDPGPLLSLGVALGSVDQVSIQNMDLQHQQFMALHGYTNESQSGVAVVAVAPGDGIARVFKDLGVAQIVSGGQTMNPSAAQLLDAVRRANAQHTVILPNNPNIVMAANQAATIAGGGVYVVPSRNVPQGVAAMLAFNPEFDAQQVFETMSDALGSVRSGEVTTAVRSTRIGGIDVHEGQAIAMLDDELVAAAASPNEALIALLQRAEVSEGTLVTLYTGHGNPQSQTGFAINAITARFPGVEVEVIDGGQAHYNYLVSIE